MASRQSEVVRLSLPTGGALEFYLSYENERTDWAVLYVHGFGSTRTGVKAEALEEACGRRGWTFAAFDFRGHGASTGTLLELTGTGLLEDLAAARDYLVGRGIRRFCPVGSSMGGWAAAWFTLRERDSVPACVLMAPAFDFLHKRFLALSPEEQARWKQSGRLRFQSEWVDAEIGYGLVESGREFPAERLAAELSRPVLIFHGMMDTAVPYADSIAFLERAVHPEMELRLLKDGDHRLLSYRHQIAEAACEFFAGQNARLASSSS
jgi:alpha-beta hydrolase superfamily lysophospholipase